MFTVLDLSNQGQNTYTKLTGLDFQQGKTYYLWVIGKLITGSLYTAHKSMSRYLLIVLSSNLGTDKSGDCAMTYKEFLVDVSLPREGELKTGPWYNMVSEIVLNNT